eukprot:14125113-Ditylum_brightwellii.AAC.1
MIKSKTGTMGSIFMATLRAATLKDTEEIQEVERDNQELERMPKLPDWVYRFFLPGYDFGDKI